MKQLNVLTLALIIIGGLNWGLVGAANFDLVAAVLGAGSAPAKAVYILVGVSALFQIGRLFASDRSSGSVGSRAIA